MIEKYWFTWLKNVFLRKKKSIGENIQDVSENVSQEISKDFQNPQQLIDIKELNDTNVQSLQKKILNKKNITAQKKYWLKQWTDELVKNNDKAGLEQLDKWIDFTKRWGLIVNTSKETLRFEPKIWSFDDVKHIEWIKRNENVWTKNESTHMKWLRANVQSVEIMKNGGKKICSNEQYISAINVFPWGNEFSENHPSTRAKIFKRLLGSQDTGFRYPDGRWHDEHYLLRTWTPGYYIKSSEYTDNAELDSGRQDWGLSVWFLED